MGEKYLLRVLISHINTNFFVIEDQVTENPGKVWFDEKLMCGLREYFLYHFGLFARPGSSELSHESVTDEKILRIIDAIYEMRKMICIVIMHIFLETIIFIAQLLH